MSRKRTLAVASALGLAAAVAAAVPTVLANAQEQPTQANVILTQVATAAAPTAGTTGPGGTVWIAERAGLVRVLGDEGLGEPVLDITAETSTEGERGLLGIVFDPAFEHFYVSFTDLAGTTNVDEFAVVGGELQLETRRSVLTQQQPFSNHNGGHLAFGPDGMLYISLGDGGGSGDAADNAQNLGTLLGTLLRIDPTGADPYAVPPDNPFVDDPEALDEIWAYGLRNPWRFSFDAVTGDLWIGDVGQNTREEVNREPAASGGGENYGWARMEGTLPFSGEEPDNHVPPVFEYDNDGARCSITGGHVYRGSAIPELQGSYLFSDFCDGTIRALELQDGQVVGDTDLGVNAGNVVSFVEGPDLELYVLNIGLVQGAVFRIDPPTSVPPTSVPPTSVPPTSEPPTGACDVAVGLDQWDSGFVANYTVTNNGVAWNGWTLTFTVAGGTQHAQGWNGQWSQQGDTVTVTNEAWNAAVGTGQSVMPGHQASHTGTVSFSNFAVNGVACSMS